MSYARMYIARSNGDLVGDLTLSNGWGSAPSVWEPLCDKYDALIKKPGPPRFMDRWPALWEWAKENHEKLSWWEWNALRWTYDGALVKREDFMLMAQSLDMFRRQMVRTDRVCHLAQVAKRLQELFENEPDVQAVGHYHTSVSHNPWGIPCEDGEDESRPYNIERDDAHWFIEMAPNPDRKGA